MLNNSIDDVFKNALLVDKDTLSKNIRLIINDVKKSIKDNADLIIESSVIDNKNKNGFIIDYGVINNVFASVEKENLYYKDVILSQKDDDKKIIYGKEVSDIGNVVIINDGNFYTILEMAIRNLIAGNNIIFVNNGYMMGSVKLLIEIIQAVLEKFNVSKYMIQICFTSSYEEVLANYANIDLVICIGNHDLQSMILNKSKNKTIVSGYENFDLYVEDLSHIDFIDKILKTNLNINLYVNEKLNLKYDDMVSVSDINEAISMINYNSERYSSSIFTKSAKNASNFVSNVKSKMVMVNTSPTIERVLDIKQTELFNEKIIIYPCNNLLEKKEK